MKQEQGYNIADTANDFIGYKIMMIEQWNTNIKRVWMVKDDLPALFYIVYADEQFTKNLIEGEIYNG